MESGKQRPLPRPCPACRNRDSRPHSVLRDHLFRVAEGDFVYRCCTRCRSLFLSPLPSQAQISGFYQDQYWWHPEDNSLRRKLEGWYRSYVIRDHGRFLKGLAPRIDGRPADLLDIGCGSGSFLNEARRRGFAVTGMDSSALARDCLRRMKIRILKTASGPGEEVENRFDVLTFFHVLEHFRDPEKELRDLLPLVRRGGALIVQVPLLDSWQARLFGPKWYGLDPPRHLTQFTAQGLQMFFDHLGLTIEKVWHFSLRDNAPAIISSFFPRLDPMARQVAGISRRPAKEGILRVLYLILVLAATSFALLEAAWKKGGTIILRLRVSG